jgi:hypothetical protein
VPDTDVGTVHRSTKENPMTRSQTLSRTLATTLAISALAAPAAGAKPVNVHAVPYAVPPVTVTDLRAPDQQAPANSSQDLRSPDAADAGRPVSPQDLRSPDAADAGRPVSPQPIRSASVQSDGTPWSTIGLALLGCLALAGTATAAGRIRRSRRAGVAA